MFLIISASVWSVMARCPSATSKCRLTACSGWSVVGGASSAGGPAVVPQHRYAGAVLLALLLKYFSGSYYEIFHIKSKYFNTINQLK